MSDPKAQSILDLPAHLQHLAIFINRVGFQMFAFIAMLGLCAFIFWFGTKSLEKMTSALTQVTQAVQENTTATKEIKTWITDSHKFTKEVIRTLQDDADERDERDQRKPLRRLRR